MLFVSEPARPHRSSGSSPLAIPQSRTKTFGDAAFSHYAPGLWNSLPKDLRGATNVDNIKCKLKTYLSSLAFMQGFYFLFPILSSFLFVVFLFLYLWIYFYYTPILTLFHYLLSPIYFTLLIFLIYNLTSILIFFY